MLFVQLVHLGEHGLREEVHESHDFFFGAFPVLGRERIDGEVLHTYVVCGTNGLAHRLDAGGVPLQAVESAFLRPSTVAVHDDGNMDGNAPDIDRRRVEIGGRIGEYLGKGLVHVDLG